MRKLFILAAVILFQVTLFAQTTYIYFENSTNQSFTATSVQTGTHILESNEWWYSTSDIPAWRNETNVLWTNRNSGIHWGDDFYLTTTLTCNDFSIDLKLKLHGDFVGSTIWSAAAGPGFSHGWSSDNNFHSSQFTVNGKTYELKYTFYFTGGADDILFTLHEYDAFSTDAAELADPDIMNVLAYNTYMLTPPIALSDQGTRAQHIDEAVHGLDAILIQEVFDNSARATLLSELAVEYPYQTPVVDLPNILDDGGIMIASRWPIEYYQQMVWNDCNTPDCLANKGVMYARINKLGRKYHLFSTHQQAFNGTEDVAVRNLQMQQFNAFIDAQNIPADEAVIFGGDMNVDKYTNKQGEYDNMFSIFNASVPTYIGHPYSWDKYSNHYIGSGSEEPEYLDYVLADNDYRIPVEQSNTVWILRSNHDDMWNIHDLSDHFGMHGRFVYTPPVDPCSTTNISLSAVVTDETYDGSNDGSIDVSVSGGLAPYTYNWSNGSSTEDLSGLAAGNYTLTVTDANGCSEISNSIVGVNTDCYAATGNFDSNPLTHTRAGSSSTTVNLPAVSYNASFDISGINQVTGGKANKRYVELVTVSYVDGNGSSQVYGSYSGASVSSAIIDISGGVQSITVELEDIYDGDTRSTMSVSMTTVDYCGGPPCDDADGDGVCDDIDACPGLDDALIGTSCDDGDNCTENDVYDSACGCSGIYTDSDGDGVCDANDICPGGDDNIDTDGDGTPDFCDNGDCNAATGSFNTNPLTHSGGGSSSATYNLPAGHTDAEFSVSNIGSVTGGKPKNRYIERVTITYVDDNGNNQTYGTFDAAGTVNVLIAGGVQSITVELSDAYDGSSSKTMSVDLSDVASCGPAAARIVGKSIIENSIELFPNPTTDILYVRHADIKEGTAIVRIYSIGGHELIRKSVNSSENIQLDVSELVDGIYLIHLIDSKGAIQAAKFMKQ